MRHIPADYCHKYAIKDRSYPCCRKGHHALHVVYLGIPVAARWRYVPAPPPSGHDCFPLLCPHIAPAAAVASAADFADVACFLPASCSNPASLLQTPIPCRKLRKHLLQVCLLLLCAGARACCCIYSCCHHGWFAVVIMLLLGLSRC